MQRPPDRIGRGNVFVEEVADQARVVERAADAGMGQNRLGLGAEGQPAAGQLRVEERLLAHPIAHQNQPVPPGVPDRRREHAVEPASEIEPFLFIEVDQALGVARRAVAMAFGFELFPQLELVVELAVVGDPDRAILVGHRLSAAGHVDDRQPAMPERSRSLAVKTVAVRPAMRQCGRHPLDDRAIGRLTGAIHESGDSAHEISLKEPETC